MGEAADSANNLPVSDRSGCDEGADGEDAADGFGFGQVVTLPKKKNSNPTIFLKNDKKKKPPPPPRRGWEEGGGGGGANPNPKLETSLGG